MAYPTYKYHKVFNTKPNWASVVDVLIERPFEYSVWFGTGYSYSHRNESEIGCTFEFIGFDRSEMSEIVDFFDDRMGRYGSFWWPTWQEDVVVSAAFASGATQITIEDIDYSDDWLGNELTGRYLFFRFPDGTEKYRRVTAASGTTLTLDSAIGKAATEDDLDSLLVSFLIMGRFDQDELEVEHLSESVARMLVRLRSTGTDTGATTTTSTSSSTTSGSTTTGSTTSSSTTSTTTS